VVELEDAAESFTAFDSVNDAVRSIHRLDEFISETQVIPFGMLVLDMLTDGILQ
jgi:hypothetical protein